VSVLPCAPSPPWLLVVTGWLPCKFHYILKLLARESVIVCIATLRTRRNNNYYLYGVGVNSYYNILLLLLLLLWCYNNILYTLYVIRYASFFSSLFRQERRFEGNAHIDHGSGVRRTKINEKITLVIDRFWSWKILSRNGCRALSWCLLIYEVFA